jgi:uncharacterized protein YcbK (DUF882 family)
LYNDDNQRGHELPYAIQNHRAGNAGKVFSSIIAAIVVSGCVSQQSALELNNSVASNPSQQTAAFNSAEATTQPNIIPIKAPRPATAVAQVNSQVNTQTQAAVQTAQTTVANNTPVPAATVAQTAPVNTLAVSDTTQNNSPGANVIAQATSQTGDSQAVTAQVSQAAPAQAITTPQPAQTTAQQVAVAVPQAKPTTAASQNTPAQPSNTVEVASLSPTVSGAQAAKAPQAQAVRKQGFFEKLFAPRPKAPVPQQTASAATAVGDTPTPATRIATASTVAAKNKPQIVKPAPRKPAKIVAKARTSNAASGSALPGVKSNSEIFGIKNEGSASSKSKSKNTQVASVGSLGRLSPKGLRLQHSKVQVACLKPGVLRILKMVERRYGKKPIITSGYRSPKGNRRAGGARNSQHIFCKAVDIQVPGVSKWQVAKYIRTIPGRGGVGTYCRTKSVHFDIGSKRDWHHPCRKSSKRKRKKA